MTEKQRKEYVALFGGGTVGAKKLRDIQRRQREIARGDCCEVVADMYLQLAAVNAWIQRLYSFFGTMGSPGGGGSPPPPPPAWP